MTRTISLLVLMLLCCVLATAQSITSVSIKQAASGKFRANLTGTGLTGAAIEIDAAQAERTRVSSDTRARAFDERLKAISSSGDQAVFQAVNPATGQRSAPFVLNAGALPQVKNLRNAVSKPGASVEFIVDGRNLLGGEVRISGLVTSPVIRSSAINPHTLTVSVAVPEDAAPGARALEVVTANGKVGGLEFLIIDPAAVHPVAASINPPAGRQGSVVQAQIRGFRLSGATRIDFDKQGIGASILQGGTAEVLPVELAISKDAAPGVYSLTVTTSAGRSQPISFTVEEAAQSARAVLTPFTVIGGSPDVYHMTEVPDGSYAVTQYTSRTLVLISSEGRVTRVLRNGFLNVSSIAFFSREVAYTTCVPTFLASWSFREADFGTEGVAPGNLAGVSNPRYLLGIDGLISRTFFLANGGTGEIRFVDPQNRSTARVISSGFSIAGVERDTRGLEQMAYDRTSRTLYVVDSGRNALVAVDENSGRQTVTATGFSYPFGLVLLPNSNLLVADRGTGKLIELSRTGTQVAVYDTGLGADSLRGLFVNSRGQLFLLSDRTQTLYRVDLSR